MHRRRKLAIGMCAAAFAGAGAAPAAARAPALTAPESATLRASKELWATIDVCSPADQPNVLGLRGSMPSDTRPKDRMYMSFQLQYRNAAGTWSNLAGAPASAWIYVGAGASRQGGTSFVLKPPGPESTFDLRGVVRFQWRRGKAVLLTVSRPTTAGHRSVIGADPAEFSIATCQIA